MNGIPFPNIDPVLIHLGPLAIRWYALAYLAGLVLGWRYCLWLLKQSGQSTPTRQDFDDFLFWATVAVIVGGRLGIVLFYHPGYYLANPLEIFATWKGGMSFHGGALGVIAAIFLFAWKRGIPSWALADLIACATPIGLFFGRIANFINGELWGRPTDVPWAFLFPDPAAGNVPRHPSQFYEAALEGLLLFALLLLLFRRKDIRERHGVLSGIFLIGYGTARSISEIFREPDLPYGPMGGISMGQLLSFPMIVVGIAILVWALRRPRVPVVDAA